MQLNLFNQHQNSHKSSIGKNVWGFIKLLYFGAVNFLIQLKE